MAATSAAKATGFASCIFVFVPVYIIYISRISSVFSRQPKMSHFIDRVKIYVKAGHGGRGCVSFRREAYVPRGGPDGGDGGKGGDVIVRADRQLGTLIDLKYQQNYLAGKGEDGRGKQQSGADAEDIIIRVPLGTVLYDAATRQTIVDMDTDEKEFIVARGGR